MDNLHCAHCGAGIEKNTKLYRIASIIIPLCRDHNKLERVK